MPTTIRQLELARWADTGGSYRTIQRFFPTDMDWRQVTWLFFLLCLYTTTDNYLLVGDETVLTKAGKPPFGLDRFFSSLADKAVPGGAFFARARGRVQKRQAYTRCAEQVARCAEQVARCAEEKQQTKQAQPTKQHKPAKPQAQDTPAPAALSTKPGRLAGSRFLTRA